MKTLLKILLLFVLLQTSVANTVHGIRLSWNASTTRGVTYRLYRSTVHTGPYSLLVSGISATVYSDYNVKVGKTYYYVATADNGTESNYSTEAVALVR